MIKIIAATTKSPHWLYEDEWRFIDPQPEVSGGHFVCMPIPIAIYVGCRVLSNHKLKAHLEKLLGVAQAKGIPVLRVSLHPKRYELESSPW